jgi:hypothetical protein
MKHTIRFILLALLLCLSGLANAQQTIRYCKCDNIGQALGAHLLCVPGNDATGDGSAANPKLSRPSDGTVDALPAGSQVLACQGGFWDNETTRVINNTNATPANPITFGSYAPPSGAAGKPILRAAGNNAIYIVGNFGEDTVYDGFVFRDMYFRGAEAGTTSWLIDQFRYAKDVLVDNMQFENAYVAMRFTPVTSTRTCERWTVRNSRLQNLFGNGVIGSCSDFLFEKNNVELNNPDGSTGEHGVYIAGRGLERNLIIRQNIFRNNSLASPGGACGSGNITVRGKKDGLVIEDNYIEVPSSTTSCYCISVIEGYPDFPNERYDRAVIRRNTCVNTHQGIQVTITPGGLIENNFIFSDVAAGGINGIGVGEPDPDDVDGRPNNMTVRNNTVVLLNATGTGSACISVNTGTGHRVYNNSCVLGSSATARGYNITGLSNFSIWDYNWTWNQGSGPWSASYSNLAAAQAAGFDVHGGNTNVQFVSTPTFSSPSGAIQSGSPLRNAGRLPVTPTEPSIRFDILNCVRDSQPDIGAYEQGASTCPTARAPVLR